MQLQNVLLLLWFAAEPQDVAMLANVFKCLRDLADGNIAHADCFLKASANSRVGLSRSLMFCCLSFAAISCGTRQANIVCEQWTGSQEQNEAKSMNRILATHLSKMSNISSKCKYRLSLNIHTASLSRAISTRVNICQHSCTNTSHRACSCGCCQSNAGCSCGHP